MWTCPKCETIRLDKYMKGFVIVSHDPSMRHNPAVRLHRMPYRGKIKPKMNSYCKIDEDSGKVYATKGKTEFRIFS